jgi:hypothetical protein
MSRSRRSASTLAMARAGRATLLIHVLQFWSVHQTLRVTPAMEAVIADHVWSIEEIVGLLD